MQPTPLDSFFSTLLAGEESLSRSAGLVVETINRAPSD